MKLGTKVEYVPHVDYPYILQTTHHNFLRSLFSTEPSPDSSIDFLPLNRIKKLLKKTSSIYDEVYLPQTDSASIFLPSIDNLKVPEFIKYLLKRKH